ncbi:transposase [Micromonospora sp. CNZ280]|uniref:transposase n=1 Tax=Micromonospora echinaurantiaca TaxID=47857 RepID=UPI0014244FD8
MGNRRTRSERIGRPGAHGQVGQQPDQPGGVVAGVARSGCPGHRAATAASAPPPTGSRAARCCPNAVGCADALHVVAWATDAADRVRRQAWKKAVPQLGSGSC